MPTFPHDGIDFHYHDAGSGLPFAFQHGLSGDFTKILEVIGGEPRGCRLISFDARYHGKTRPLGPPEKIGFNQSADDLLALLDHLRIEKAVIGGISMGAGIALNFATRYPDRVLGLVLSRPAWSDEPLGENVLMFPELASLVREHGPKAAREVFAKGPTYAKVLSASADSAAALLGMFDDPACEETIDRFERIPRDCPAPDRATWRAIAVPTLILANHQDPIHPHAIGTELAKEVSGAELRILTPKCVDIPAHNRDFNRHLQQFLAHHFSERMKSVPSQ